MHGAILMLLMSLLPAVAMADAAALVREASSAYGSAERAFFSGKVESARDSLNKARELTEQALAEDPDNVQAKSLNNRVRSLTDKLDARLGTSAKKEEAPAAPQQAAEGGPVAVPSGATTLLRDIDRKLDEIDRLVGKEAANYSDDYREKASQAALKEAQEHMATLRHRHEARMGATHPEIVARQQRIDAAPARIDAFVKGLTQAAANREQAAAQASGASGPWVERLRPYVVPPYNPGGNAEKYLVSSATMDRDELQKRLGIYAAAREDLKAYRAANVSAKTEELSETEGKLAEALAEFEESLIEYGNWNKQETTQQMEHWKSFAAEQVAKTQKGEQFYLISKDAVTDLQRRIDETAMFVQPDDKEVAALKKDLEQLRRTDYDLRKKRIADTRMGADQYTGEDKAAVVKMAGEVVLKKKPNAQVLRTIVRSSDWNHQAQWEYTDTTRTAMRYRVTRSVTAEVCAKDGTEVILHTIDISKDRGPEGSWGALYGHIMYDQPILEENVSK